jgi:hypothetical protein
LYAITSADPQRRHVVDARALTREEWTVLARAVRRATEGRIRLDLRGLDQTRLRDD